MQSMGLHRVGHDWETEHSTRCVENHIWRLAGASRITLRLVPWKRNDLEKSDTSEAKLGLSALDSAVRNWKMAKRWGACPRVMSRIRKMQRQYLSPVNFPVHTSRSSQFTQHFKEELSHLTRGFNHLLRKSAFLLPEVHWKTVLLLPHSVFPQE